MAEEYGMPDDFMIDSFTDSALAEAKEGKQFKFLTEAELEQISYMPMKEYMQWRSVQSDEKLAEIDEALAAVDQGDEWDKQYAMADELSGRESPATLNTGRRFVVANPYGALGDVAGDAAGAYIRNRADTERGEYDAQSAQVAALRRELLENRHGGL